MARLTLTREQLAERIGVAVKTVNKWMAPEGSEEFRSMPAMARKYIMDIIRWSDSNYCNTPSGGVYLPRQKDRRGGYMNMRERILDAVLDGSLGRGTVVTRQELMQHFNDVNPAYTGVILSNAEMNTGGHSPTWEHYTQRLGRGVYRIHPDALAERLRERESQSASRVPCEYPDATDDSDEAMDQRFQASLDDPRT